MTPTRRLGLRALRSAALLLLAAPLMALSCHDEVTTYTKCPLISAAGPLWGKVTITRPVMCPLYLPSMQEDLLLAAETVLYESTYSRGEVAVYNVQGGLEGAASNFSMTHYWDEVKFRDAWRGTNYVEYNAGRYTYAGDQYNGHDEAITRVYAMQGMNEYRHAISFSRMRPAAIAGLRAYLPWEDFQLEGRLHDPTLVPPVTYEWLVDGQVVPGANGTTLDQNAGAAGTQRTYQFRVRDVYGRTTETVEYPYYTKLCDYEGCLDQRRAAPTAPTTVLP